MKGPEGRSASSRSENTRRPWSTPEVECIGKGTAIALSEFRRKVSMATPVTHPTVVLCEGDTADPVTLASQVQKLKARFGLRRIVVVGDRGLITAARIREDLEPTGLDWITALRAPQIKQLIEAGPLQLSLFDDRDLAEIASPD